MLFPDDTANLTQHQLRVRLLRVQAHRDFITGVMLQIFGVFALIGAHAAAASGPPAALPMTGAAVMWLAGFVCFFTAYLRARNSFRVGRPA